MESISTWLDKQKQMEGIIDDFFYNKVFRIHDDLSKYIYNLVGSGSFENIVKRSLKDDLFDLSRMDYQFRDEVPYIYGKCYVDRFFILYLLLRGFHHQKDNFDNFKVIVDDLKEYRATYMYFDVSDFITVMDTIELILSNKNYKDLVNTRSYLKMLYEKMGSISFDAFRFAKKYESYLKIYEDGKQLGSDDIVVSKVFDKMIGNLLKNNKNEFYYNKILLFSNRFEYFNDNLYRIEDNRFIRSEIVSLLDKFSVDMFNELNVGSNKDSFVTSMGCVFDSDTYYELFNKLYVIFEASELFDKGYKSDALELIKDLNSAKHKEKLFLEVVAYPSNSINMINKPDKIIDRMKELYPKFDDRISYDFLDEVHDNAKYHTDINSVISAKRDSLIEVFKQKLKVFHTNNSEKNKR